MGVSEWKDLVYVWATVLAIPGVIFAAYKTWGELKRVSAQRQAELIQREAQLAQQELSHSLKRAEFTLAQHRRLFDDSTLWSVLRKLDDNHPDLGKIEMWDAKRKFLTFFEELTLLVNSGLVNKSVALYMFGYYAVFARQSSNFAAGIEFEPEYWGLFLQFADEAVAYFEEFSPELLAKLKL